MRLLSADRRDLEPLLGRIDVMVMAPSGRDGGADWPSEPSERDGYELLAPMLALVLLVPLVLSKWKLRVKRLSSLVRRETASLKECRGLQGLLNKCSLVFKSVEESEGEVGNSGLALVFPSEYMVEARRSKKM
jgi:hypothetical protein